MNGSGNVPVIRFGGGVDESELHRLRQENAHLTRAISALQKAALPFGYVVRSNEDRTLISHQGVLVELETPPALKLHPGDAVRLRPENQAIVGHAAMLPETGPVAPVLEVLENAVVADTLTGPRLVACGFDAKIGDRVVCDSTATVVIKNLGPSPTLAAFAGDTGVSWDDIGGLDSAKRDLREAIEEPLKYPDVYAKYGKAPAKGILLHGPSGTGKTMLGRAAATALASLHGASTKATGFIYVKGPELLDKWVGGSEASVRKLFESARRHRAMHGYPALIFIDEADAILASRSAKRGIEGMEKTIVPQFLAEMDGLDDSGALVLIATNRPDTLDPAIVRDGRVDRKVYVPRPTKKDAVEIFKKHLKTRADLAELFAEELFSTRRHMRVKDKQVLLGDLASGALCKGIVERAIQLAIRKEIDAGVADGLTDAIVCEACDAALEEHRHTSHDELASETPVPDASRIVTLR